jgi:hypothetical protein
MEVKSLCGVSEKHGVKLDTLTDTIATAKGMAKAFGWLLSIFGAIGLVLLASILTVLLHHFKMV